MSTSEEPVRWGILGAADIARSAFLPALREAGGGVPVAVASRDGARAQAWAADNGVGRGLQGYERLLADPAIEAVYVPLPNGLHAEWTIAALEAGKAVFCEKPLCGTPDETERVLATATSTGGLVWEAFVFPFHEQIDRVQRLLGAGELGDVREVNSMFHFLLDDRTDIRMSAELAGGAAQDVGCYPVALARLLFLAEPDLDRTIADAAWEEGGVDTELWGALAFPGDRRLVFSCGFRGEHQTLTRVLGTDGEVRMTNPFHPEPDDTFTLLRDGKKTETAVAVSSDERSFTPALRHVHRVIRGLEAPRHLAVDEAMGNAAAIAALLQAAHGGGGHSPRAM